MVWAISILGVLGFLAFGFLFILVMGCARRLQAHEVKQSELTDKLQMFNDWSGALNKYVDTTTEKWVELGQYAEILEDRHRQAAALFRIIFGPRDEETISVVVDTDTEGLKN